MSFLRALGNVGLAVRGNLRYARPRSRCRSASTSTLSCNPVMIDGKYAYVTLRSGRTCSGGANALEVIDLTNFNQPRLVSAFAMFSPQGLGAEKITSTPATMAWRYLTPAAPRP